MRSGFSLIELVVVLLVISIAGAVMVPNFAINEQSDRLGDSVADLTAVLNAARDAAIERGADAKLVIMPSTGAWWVIADRAPRQIVAHGALRSSVPVSGLSPTAPLEFQFSATGAVAGAAIELTVDGRNALILADAWSGRVHVQ